MLHSKPEKISSRKSFEVPAHRMKFLFLVYQPFGSGGTFLRASHIAQGFVSLKHEVLFVCDSPHVTAWFARKKEGGVTYLLIPRIAPFFWSKSGFSFLSIAIRLLLIHTQTHSTTLYTFGHRPSVSIPAMYARWRGNTIIADWCDDWSRNGLGSKRTTIAGKFLSTFDSLWQSWYFQSTPHYVTTISQFLFDTASKLRRTPTVYQLGIGIPPNIDRIHTMPPRIPNMVLGYMGITKHDDTFFFQFLLSFSRFARNRSRTSWHLHYIGPVPFWKQFLPLPITRHITFHGFQAPDKSLDILKKCSLLLVPFPSSAVNRARIPHKLVEYMKLPQPIISQKTGDLPKMFHHYKVGMLGETQPKSFAQTVLKASDSHTLFPRVLKEKKKFIQEKQWKILLPKLIQWIEEHPNS